MRPPSPPPERLGEIVGRFSSVHVSVLGDLIADVFLYGEIARVSREAPVMILREERTLTLPGGAGNAAANAASLGAKVELIGVVGDDASGGALLGHLKEHGIDCEGVSAVSGHRTPTKTRILAGLGGSSRQQVIRVDHEPLQPLTDHERGRAAGRLRSLTRSSVVMLSDYHYGFLDGRLRDDLLTAGRTATIPWIVDSRHRLAAFRGLTAATPNLNEAEELLNCSLSSMDAIRSGGKRLQNQLEVKSLLITLGGNGMMLFSTGCEPAHLDVIGPREPVDVTGAGDTVIAAFALALGAGADPLEAAALANHAGGVAVMKRGTASVTTEELLSSIFNPST
ncbi:MAG: bifunctional hydroxymethylpyrimidine kinase/phosphomethylpyrimidine kinase [Acidobacteria bacterium]|nr:bifunctional hydroxymethylpyrimidine kinase/phosphomethylpyrimidine kinase [Acidobacteriota bacterium]